jgi:hypothetical protein
MNIPSRNLEELIDIAKTITPWNYESMKKFLKEEGSYYGQVFSTDYQHILAINSEGITGEIYDEEINRVCHESLKYESTIFNFTRKGLAIFKITTDPEIPNIDKSGFVITEDHSNPYKFPLTYTEYSLTIDGPIFWAGICKSNPVTHNIRRSLPEGKKNHTILQLIS